MRVVYTYVGVGDDDIQELNLYILYGVLYIICIYCTTKKVLERINLVNGEQVSIKSEI